MSIISRNFFCIHQTFSFLISALVKTKEEDCDKRICDDSFTPEISKIWDCTH